MNSLLIAENYSTNAIALFFHNRLYKGNRITKSHPDRFDAFSSSNFKPLLEVGVNIYWLHKETLKKSKQTKNLSNSTSTN